MSLPTLLVRLDLGRSNAGLLKVVGDVAERLGAAVVGAVACQPVQMLYGDGFLAAEVIEQDRAEIDQDIAKAEAEFQAVLRGRAQGLEWRSLVTFGPLCEFFTREARCADLVVTGPALPAPLFDTARHVDVGDLVMQCGRPVLVVPAEAAGLPLKQALVGWKDTRETRRALMDAVPVLQKAEQVMVAEVVHEPDGAAARGRLADVARWLARHGIEAETRTVKSRGEDAERLSALAAEINADLIVAGAYGHSRMRELVLGGVTYDLLLRASRCALLSH
ncbi:universal stress protein [Phenylobacterium montanum]|uniref:Universal stress protein n=1 Tax=Phenylobacterium montanum TaxID=2823693 RepID=A0A975FYZ4_9CAUL|nr:universal stress protein [Caulobacter sp. S6]QUD87754.1 universal stress protein [Caulobacter sp. S6]